MEYDKNICPVVNVDGVIERGKQYEKQQQTQRKRFN